jgi:hypothetical protein
VPSSVEAQSKRAIYHERLLKKVLLLPERIGYAERENNTGMHGLQAAQLRDYEEQAHAFGPRRVYQVLSF